MLEVSHINVKVCSKYQHISNKKYAMEKKKEEKKQVGDMPHRAVMLNEYVHNRP